MSDDFFPGFIEDDKPARPKSVPPPPPPQAAPPAAAPAPMVPVTQAGPGAGDADADADIKPGAAKDLWACPHCGTKNKPQRTTCRSCAKSPDEEVVVKQWHESMGVRIGLGAGVLVLLLITLSTCEGSAEMAPAGAEHVDSAVRFGGALGEPQDVANRRFTPRKHLAVSGRIIDSMPLPATPALVTVVLALGSAAEDETFKDLAVEFGSEVTVRPEAGHVVLHCHFPGPVPDLGKGRYLSIEGDSGEMVDPEGGTLVEGTADQLVVRVDNASSQ